MSESIKLIYKILKILEQSMDYPEFDVDRLSPETLGISASRRDALLEMLLKKGYIDGIEVKKYIVFRGPEISPSENGTNPNFVKHIIDEAGVKL